MSQPKGTKRKHYNKDLGVGSPLQNLYGAVLRQAVKDLNNPNLSPRDRETAYRVINESPITDDILYNIKKGVKPL